MISPRTIRVLAFCAFAPALAVSKEMHKAAHSNAAFDQFKSLLVFFSYCHPTIFL
jgi:hypothetical protein